MIDILIFTIFSFISVPENPQHDYIPFEINQSLTMQHPILCIQSSPYPKEHHELYNILKSIHVWTGKLNSATNSHNFNIRTMIDGKKCDITIKWQDYSTSAMVAGNTELPENIITLYGWKYDHDNFWAMIQDYKYQPILEHELGHVFGIQHLFSLTGNQFESIMESGGAIYSNMTVTDNDINAVLHIYGYKGWGHSLNNTDDIFYLK